MTGVVVATVIMVVVAASAALATAAAAGRGARAAAEDERGNTPAGRREVTYDGRALILDGVRRMLFSGEMHYPRSTPEVRTPLDVAYWTHSAHAVMHAYVVYSCVHRFDLLAVFSSPQARFDRRQAHRSRVASKFNLLRSLNSA